MTTDAGLGAAVVVLAGLLHGSFALPMKRMGKWKWENTWLVYSVAATLLLPALLAWFTVPSLGSVYANAPASALAAAAVFGFGWGLGSTLFGQGIARVGMALGFAVILGITSSLGSLLPLLILNPGGLWTGKGALLVAGLVIVVIGLVLCGRAGALRDRDQKSSGGFVTGLVICILSGVLSPMLNFGFVFGRALQDAAVSAGARPDLAGNAIWAPALAAGFLPNAGYALYLMRRNRSAGLFFLRGVPRWYWLGGLAMGALWYGGISIYGMGAAVMGPLGGVLGWPVFMSTVIVTANVLGFLTGEWKGAGAEARRLAWAGIGVLIVAIVVIAKAN
ncbi:MAG: L-rhamnose/proton symporter RhaT [Bryobacteraceae bacterium]